MDSPSREHGNNDNHTKTTTNNLFVINIIMIPTLLRRGAKLIVYYNMIL